MKFSEDELMWFAFMFAECDRRQLANAYRELNEVKLNHVARQADELADQLHEYRISKWGEDFKLNWRRE